MALVNVTNVMVLDNPTNFTNPLTFEVTFECIQELDADLEFKVIYVGSAEDQQYDQVLEEVDVGPIPVGVNRFVLTADSPDPATIPSSDLVGVTVTLISCCYKEKEFIRVGYYVNNEHTDPAINADIQEGRIPPPESLDPQYITRNILADQPRVTRFPIDWNAAQGEQGTVADGQAEGEEQMEADVEEDDDMDAENDNVGEEGSESMGSEGEGDGDMEADAEGSVDLEAGSGGEAALDGDPEMDADSSGAEEMEDFEGDKARASVSASTSAPVVPSPTREMSTCAAGEGPVASTQSQAITS